MKLLGNPSASTMPDAPAVSVLPTCAAPVIAGFPVAAVLTAHWGKQYQAITPNWEHNWKCLAPIIGYGNEKLRYHFGITGLMVTGAGN